MQDFIARLVEIMKGTASNMKRGLDGTAMEEMRQHERDRNAALIDNAYPGGMPKYARDHGMMGSSTPPKRETDSDQYNATLRSILNKP